MSDLISRQAVLDELEKWDWQELYLPIHFKQILDNVPSVENKGDLISRERLINEWDDLGRRYAMPTTPIHKRAFREFPSADARENISVKFISEDADCRGYAKKFRCSNCGMFIYPESLTKELDYDFCPWCGGKDE